MDNPFNPNQPAAARFFANRGTEQRWLRMHTLPSLSPGGAGPQNTAILGPWGVGKTSLAYRFQSITQTAAFPVVSAFFSCTTGYGDLLGFADALLTAIADEIHLRKDWPERIRDEVLQWRVDVHLPIVHATRQASRQDHTISAAEVLRRGLREIWARFLADRGAGAVIILDDVQALQTMDDQALLILRAVFQDLHLAGARYGLLITGPSTLFEDIRDVAEPVTRFFERMKLEPFTRRDLADAVRQPLEAVGAAFTVPQSFLNWLWEQTNGHPYFVSFIMRGMVAEADEGQWNTLSPPHVSKAWPAIAARLHQDRFDVDWGAATRGERDILHQVAASPPGAPFRAAEYPGLNRGLLSRLTKKGLVVRLERGEYALYHPLFTQYVQRLAAPDVH